jgi:hypothetical protein
MEMIHPGLPDLTARKSSQNAAPCGSPCQSVNACAPRAGTDLDLGIARSRTYHRIQGKEELGKVECGVPAASPTQIPDAVNPVHPIGAAVTHEMIRCRAVNIGLFSTLSKSSRHAPEGTLKLGARHLSKAYSALSA